MTIMLLVRINAVRFYRHLQIRSRPPALIRYAYLTRTKPTCAVVSS